MSKYRYITAAIVMSGLLGACATHKNSLPTQENVDLEKYAGVWYEQALLPNRFQKKCVSDVSAEYLPLDTTRLQVINQCRNAAGSLSVAEGVARLNSSNRPTNPAVLQVRFAPAWLSWLPMVWGNYWIIKTVGEYEYSLVGSPDRKYLWVLSREKQADATVVSELLEYAGSLGFAIDEVKYTEQNFNREKSVNSGHM